MYSEILRDLFIEVIEESYGELWEVTLLNWENVNGAIEACFRINTGRELKVITKRREL